jgi:hypothetical protein
VPIFRYFWFFVAAVMAVNILIWQRLLAERVARGTLAADDARRFVRGAARWLVTPCLVLGAIAVAAGWSDPFCAGLLSFRDGASAATSLVIVGLWTALLAWVWAGDGAALLGRVATALRDRGQEHPISPAVVRIVTTAAVVASGAGAVLSSRRVPEGCALPQHPSGGAPMPGLQVVLLIVAAATWLIGGNLLVAWHYRRRGKSPWSGFRPFAFPFKDFDATEWLALAALAVLALALGAIAISARAR